MTWHAFDEKARRGQAPVVQLPSNRGAPISLAAYRNRQNLLLVFTHASDCERCRAVIQVLDGQSADFQDRESKALVILPESVKRIRAITDDLGLSLTLLADLDQQAKQTYQTMLSEDQDHRVLAFVLDRYGAPYAALSVSEFDPGEHLDQCLEWLDFIELQCPE